jgi:hypothetical protein
VLEDLKKIKGLGKGFLTRLNDDQPKPVIKEGCFDPDITENWIVKDEGLYLPMDLLCSNCGAMNDYNKDFCINCNTIL